MFEYSWEGIEDRAGRASRGNVVRAEGEDLQAGGKGNVPNERVPVAGFSRVGAFERRRSSSTYLKIKFREFGTRVRGVSRE